MMSRRIRWDIHTEWFDNYLKNNLKLFRICGMHIVFEVDLKFFKILVLGRLDLQFLESFFNTLPILISKRHKSLNDYWSF